MKILIVIVLLSLLSNGIYAGTNCFRNGNTEKCYNDDSSYESCYYNNGNKTCYGDS